MINKKTVKLKKRGELELRITTTVVLLLMIVGIYMSHHNKEKFINLNSIYTFVSSTEPTDKATSIVADKLITVVFNEEMNPATINNKSFILMQGLNVIQGTINPSNSPTAIFTFTPHNPLLPFTQYTVIIKKGVKAPNGLVLKDDCVWSFSTQPQVILTSNPHEGGTTTGGGSFNTESLITVYAAPALGYIFKNWTERNKVVSTRADCALNLNSNRTLIANFLPLIEDASKASTDSPVDETIYSETMINLNKLISSKATQAVE